VAATSADEARDARRALRLLLAAAPVNALGTGLVLSTSVLYFTRHVGIAPAAVGAVLAVTGTAGIAAIVPAGRLADRYGVRPVLVAVYLWRAVGYAGYAVAPSLAWFAAVSALLYLVDRAANPLTQALVAAAVPAQDRGRVMGLLRSSSNVGLAAGTAVAGIAVALDSQPAYRLLFVGNAASLLLWAALLARLPVGRAPAPTRPAHPDRPAAGRAPLRDRRFVALTASSAVLYLHDRILLVALPIWVVEHTTAPRQLVTLAVVLNMALTVLLQVPVAGRVGSLAAARRGMTWVAALLAGLCGLFAGAGLAGPPALAAGLVLAAAVVLTAAELIHSAAAWQLCFQLAPDADRGRYIAFFTLGTAAEEVLAPAVLLVLLTGLGGLGWLLLAAAFPAAAAVLRAVVPAGRTRPAKPAKSTGPGGPAGPGRPAGPAPGSRPVARQPRSLGRSRGVITVPEAPHLLLVSGGRNLPRMARELCPGLRTTLLCQPDEVRRVYDIDQLQRLIVINSAAPVQEWVHHARSVAALEPVDRVACYVERDMDKLAAIAAALGLPAHSVETVHAVDDKLEMRRRLRAAGVDDTPSAPVGSAQDVADFAAQHGYPVICKPVSGVASEGISRITGASEIHTALRWSEQGKERVGAAALLVERYHRGQEFSVECVSEAGEHVAVCVTAKHSERSRFVEMGHVVPAPLAADQYARLCETTVQALRALGVHTGVTHTEVIDTGTAVHLVETHLRLAGDQIPAMCAKVRGVDLRDVAARLSLGMPVLADVRDQVRRSDEHRQYAAIWYATPDAVGELIAVDGTAEAEATPGVCELVVSVEPGSRLTAVSGSYSRAAYVWAVADSADEALARAYRAVSRLRFVVSASGLPRDDDALQVPAAVPALWGG
jgi:biotin carboxylase/MFS family permease